MEKRRNSGLELLRIIGIILVISFHYMMQADFPALTVSDVKGGLVFVQSISMFGRVACSLFAIISGFFLIEKERVNLSRIVMIVFDVAFFTVLIAALTWLSGLAPGMMPWLFRSDLNWYIIFYVLFCFLVPYINRFLRALDGRTFGKFMLTVFIIWSVLPTVTFRQIDFGEMDFFIVMYTAGAFIRLHVYGKTKYKNIWNLAIALGAAALMVLSVVVMDALAVKTGNVFFLDNACYFREFNMVPAVVCTVFLFLFFANLNFYSKTINFMAGSVLQILIIHVNKYFAWFAWHRFSSNSEHIDWPYLHAPVKIACVFGICLLVSIAYRLTLRKPVERLVNRRLPPKASSGKERGVSL